VEWTSKALKQATKLDKSVIQTIMDAVDTLENWPDCRNVKALVGRDGYRLRVGRYRVLFTIHDGVPRIVKVMEVKKRDEQTY
jgi:mRNA-degrading endonuclease RelE of RelBE toxin-antitoxin system